jgi:hypothetical protein
MKTEPDLKICSKCSHCEKRRSFKNQILEPYQCGKAIVPYPATCDRAGIARHKKSLKESRFCDQQFDVPKECPYILEQTVSDNKGTSRRCC